VQGHFGDGQRFDVNIRYGAGPLEWETGQRVWEAQHLLKPRFLLLYGDNFTPFRPGPLLRQHESSASVVTLTAARKTPGNLRLGTKGQVDVYDRTRQATGLAHVERPCHKSSFPQIQQIAGRGVDGVG
jgi:NDP-sugar pyrophosphorylase family protein